jgi:hypothetical protein
LACSASLAFVVIAPIATAGPAPAAAPVVVNFVEVFDAANACTAQPETLTFSGTLRIQEFGRQTIIHGSGSVTTTEGYVGMFNRQFVFQGDQVTTLHFFDMEIGPDGQRQLFTGVVHVTFVNGIPKAEVENLRLQCVGKA